MTRIKDCFDRLKQQNRTALIPFITAGDPQPAFTVPFMHALVNAGADIIELGIPFSDPMADGPVIQKASERALAAGTRLKDVLEMVKTFREKDNVTPIVLMGYLNPIEMMGYEAFAQAAHESGVDGILSVDLPPEEAEKPLKIFKQYQLDPIFLLAPNSDDERIKKVAHYASGYLYYVSLKGVTGSANLDVNAVNEKMQQIRQHTDIPIGVGFGIKDPETAAKVAKVSDAVIVGSALVKRIETLPHGELLESMSDFVKSLRHAMDEA
ncbi:tryptophan synthase subunit alpha [Candidatus Albibeggiatoa sp. nov. NOAA]|uniref:tryptophan synthase subunit alpha n=1 Tax=Candidatus Albibeggiatoa sp. nov. NOAA TaxID=3162724 RepID=UPI0032F29E5D|nr:tryptophan synthase subunit alpha [Thiotrichaceae bacterium]